MVKNKITAGVLVNSIRDNQNKNKTLKSLFASQFLGKMDMQELEGFLQGVEKELQRRKDQEIKKEIEYLKSQGYKVSK